MTSYVAWSNCSNSSNGGNSGMVKLDGAVVRKQKEGGLKDMIQQHSHGVVLF